MTANGHALSSALAEARQRLDNAPTLALARAPRGVCLSCGYATDDLDALDVHTDRCRWRRYADCPTCGAPAGQPCLADEPHAHRHRRYPR